MSETPEPTSTIRITGGAGSVETAAIAAVIAQVIRDEQSAAATPLQRQRLSDWLLAGRPDPFVTPRAAKT